MSVAVVSRDKPAGDPLSPSSASTPAVQTDELDRPPSCPVCHRRLVILSSRPGRDAQGVLIRRQLWGCPRGHATANYVSGLFSPVEVLPSLDD